MSNSAKNGKKKSLGDGGFGGSATVSSQLHTIHAYESHHTKEELWNSLMKAAAPTFRKRPHLPPSL